MYGELDEFSGLCMYACVIGDRVLIWNYVVNIPLYQWHLKFSIALLKDIFNWSGTTDYKNSDKNIHKRRLNRKIS